MFIIFEKNQWPSSKISYQFYNRNKFPANKVLGSPCHKRSNKGNWVDGSGAINCYLTLNRNSKIYPYRIFLGGCFHGLLACPICNSTTPSRWSWRSKIYVLFKSEKHKRALIDVKISKKRIQNRQRFIDRPRLPASQ